MVNSTKGKNDNAAGLKKIEKSPATCEAPETEKGLLEGTQNRGQNDHGSTGRKEIPKHGFSPEGSTPGRSVGEEGCANPRVWWGEGKGTSAGAKGSEAPGRRVGNIQKENQTFSAPPKLDR